MPDAFNTTTTKLEIEINGRRYTRIDDVPAAYRHLVVDADGNGLPDAVDAVREGGTPVLGQSAGDEISIRTTTTSHHVVDGSGLRMIAGLRARLRTSTPLKSLKCQQCGYDLRATPPDRDCPECGFPVAASMAGVFGQLAGPADHMQLVRNRLLRYVVTALGIAIIILLTWIVATSLLY